MKHSEPPKWLDQFLFWYCSEELIEEIQGDLHEAYSNRVKTHGKLRSQWMYLMDVIRFFRPYSFEKHSKTKQYIPMFKNYFKIAFRNLIKKKAFTALNLMGLSIGISSVLMVSLYLNHEISYDSQYPDADKIYRLVNNYRDQTYNCMFFNDYYQSEYATQTRLINHIGNYDEVIEACHFVPSNSPIGSNNNVYIESGSKKLIMNNFLYTNTGREFLKLFPQQFLKGSPSSVFSQFDRIILTESTALKIFGKDWINQALIGQSITIQGKEYLVDGVIRDIPGNVHYDFNILVYQDQIPSWGAYTYVKLDSRSSIDPVIARLNKEANLIYPGYSDDVLQKGIGYIPLTDIHFTQDMLYELKPIANLAYLRTFGIVGLIILLIIWTNYTNLSIAMYAGRQRELGVRKLLGARVKDVRLQILTEAILLTILCFPLVILIVNFTIPHFNELMAINMDQSLIIHPISFITLGAILVFTGVISGFYPAMIFSRKSLVGLFQGKLNNVKSSRIWNLRNVLLTTQFFMLVGLMSVTLIIKNQIDYVQNKSLGFEKEGVVFFNVNGQTKFNQLKTELEKFPEVKAIGSGMVPGAEMYNQLTYKLKGTGEVFADGTNIYTSLGSLDVLGIKSDALDLLTTQDSVLLINETAAKKLAAAKGVEPNELIGETLISEPEWENELFGNGQHYKIAGIIDDFDYFSLRYPSQSLILEVRRNPGWVYNALLKLESDNWFETITKIEKAYLNIEKEVPFEFQFLSDHLDQLYVKERNAGILATILSGVCLVLAMMGLIGIVGFVTLSRQREIGIRKVFGAGVIDILVTLNKGYVVMIIVATIFAIPASIFLGNQWLENFAYRITPGYLTIFIAGIITLLFVLIVSVIQSIRSANLNPTDTLRYD